MHKSLVYSENLPTKKKRINIFSPPPLLRESALIFPTNSRHGNSFSVSSCHFPLKVRFLLDFHLLLLLLFYQSSLPEIRIILALVDRCFIPGFLWPLPPRFHAWNLLPFFFFYSSTSPEIPFPSSHIPSCTYVRAIISFCSLFPFYGEMEDAEMLILCNVSINVRGCFKNFQQRRWTEVNSRVTKVTLERDKKRGTEIDLSRDQM